MERDVIFCGCGRIHTTADIEANYYETLDQASVEMLESEMGKLLRMPSESVRIDRAYRLKCVCGEEYIVISMYEGSSWTHITAACRVAAA